MRAALEVSVSRLGSVPPDPDVLLAHVEATQLVVTDAAFGLRSKRPATHQRRLDQPVPVCVGESELSDHTGAIDDERVESTVDRTVVQAQPLTADSGVDAPCSAVGHVGQAECGRVDAVEAEAVAVGADQLDLAPAGGEVVTDVDVAEETLADALDARAGEVVDLQPASLVVGDHRRSRRVAAVEPDGWVVGGVACRRDRLGLDRCRHGGQCCRGRYRHHQCRPQANRDRDVLPGDHFELPQVIVSVL